jgi:hypothetical protein
LAVPSPRCSSKFKSFNSLGSIADTSLTTPNRQAASFPIWSRLSAVLTCEWDVVEVDELNQNVKVFRLTAWAELPLLGRLAGGGLFVR